MSRTAYFDDSDKPRLVPSYCVFADFLGFKHEILEAIAKDQEEAAFRRFMDQIEPEIDNIINPGPLDDTDPFPRMWDAKVFTDNVVLGYALWSDHGEKEFGHAITQLLEFQYAVALKGFFVRGGWSFGNLFMNRNTVFGGSLLEAYQLENEKAVTPRILLSDDMKDKVFQHMARHLDDPPQIYHVLVDDKGCLFTNYLYESIVEGEVQWSELGTHAEVIAKRLEQHKGNVRVQSKYEWLAAYHNFFCDQVVNGEGYSAAVRVAGEFSNFGIRSLTHDESQYVIQAKEERRKREERIAALRAENRE